MRPQVNLQPSVTHRELVTNTLRRTHQPAHSSGKVFIERRSVGVAEDLVLMLLTALDVDEANLDCLPIDCLIQQVKVALELGVVVDQAQLLEVLLKAVLARAAQIRYCTFAFLRDVNTSYAPE